MRRVNIGEAASEAGLRPSPIRYYERLGVERLAIVRFARQVGFTMDEVRDLLDGIDRRPPPERWRRMAERKLSEVARLIADAKAIKKMLADSLAHQRPKLVERGMAVAGQSDLSRSRVTGLTSRS